jgi:hypothetical protein
LETKWADDLKKLKIRRGVCPLFLSGSAGIEKTSSQLYPTGRNPILPDFRFRSQSPPPQSLSIQFKTAKQKLNLSSFPFFHPNSAWKN